MQSEKHTDEIRRLMDMHAAGVTQPKIAAALGRSPTWVEYSIANLRADGKLPPSKRRKFTAEEDDTMQAMRAEGCTYRAIGRHLGLTEHQAYARLLVLAGREERAEREQENPIEIWTTATAIRTEGRTFDHRDDARSGALTPCLQWHGPSLTPEEAEVQRLEVIRSNVKRYIREWKATSEVARVDREEERRLAERARHREWNRRYYAKPENRDADNERRRRIRAERNAGLAESA